MTKEQVEFWLRYGGHCGPQGDVLKELGFRTASPPFAGMGIRVLHGVEVYITPLMARREDRSGFHRVMAVCPVCRKTMSAGRMHQHLPVHLRAGVFTWQKEAA